MYIEKLLKNQVNVIKTQFVNFEYYCLIVIKSVMITSVVGTI